MNTTKRIQLYEGDGLEILPESKEFTFQCCKCGIVHRIDIEHKENTKILRFYDDNKERKNHEKEGYESSLEKRRRFVI